MSQGFVFSTLVCMPGTMYWFSQLDKLSDMDWQLSLEVGKLKSPTSPECASSFGIDINDVSALEPRTCGGLYDNVKQLEHGMSCSSIETTNEDEPQH